MSSMTFMGVNFRPDRALARCRRDRERELKRHQERMQVIDNRIAELQAQVGVTLRPTSLSTMQSVRS